jgi:hypothetical protein
MEYSVQHQTLGTEGVKTNRRPGIYKCDIEGSEFELFPHELHRFPSVHTWIVEIHPAQGDPNELARMFIAAGFELLKVCRDSLTVRPYALGEKWKTHATLIARKV